MTDLHHEPTNLDLHREQARQGTLLEGLREDVRDIKSVIIGSSNKDGIVVQVDRLNRFKSITTAILWVLFTTILGTTATILAALFLRA